MARRLGHDVWIGDAAKIRASDSRQQKHDRRDAALILKSAAGRAVSADLDALVFCVATNWDGVASSGPAKTGRGKERMQCLTRPAPGLFANHG